MVSAGYNNVQIFMINESKYWILEFLNILKGNGNNLFDFTNTINPGRTDLILVHIVCNIGYLRT